jgi:hypothetical protein
MPTVVGRGAFVMTQQKHLKQLVRDRMSKDGLRYAAARRLVLGEHARPKSPHRPGCVPGATALRILLAHSGRDVSEAMAFGLAGGVGIGVFSFLYEKADCASFFVGGRHLWHDDVTYLQRACARLGLKTVVKESTAPKAAEKNLRAMLAEHGPCVAWVDMAGLPHRALPTEFSGGGYHIVTVNSIDDAVGTALIGDLTDEPVAIKLSDLAAARGRIKKDKSRLLAVEKVATAGDRAAEIADALQACHAGFDGVDAPKNARKNFTLGALATWADRLISTKDPERWERVFAPGKRLWNGLTFLSRFVEHYGSGGGLARPLMADFLTEASETLKKPALGQLAVRYAELGEMWSDLADAALPDSVPLFADAKSLQTRYSELYHSGGSADEMRDCWTNLHELGQRAAEKFPLTPAECAELRAKLSERVRAIHAAECAARDQLTNGV